jgi:hypothetical protein
MSILTAKEHVKRLLREEPSLRGVGITFNHGRECVLVNIARGQDPGVRERLRRDLPEIEVVVQEVGTAVAD